MRVLTAALRTLPLTFLIYVVEAAAALLVAAPLGLELLSDDRASFRDASGRAAWLDRTLELLPAVRVSGHTGLMVAAGLIVLSPWLRSAWLQALTRPTGVRRSLEHGARRYVSAASVSLLSVVVLAVLLLPVAAALWIGHTTLADGSYARLHDLLLAALVLPGLICVWTVHVAHDLAYARVLEQGAWTALGVGLRAALRPSVQLRALGFAAAGLILRAVQLSCTQKGLSLPAWSATLVLQTACFSVIFVRSLWLAWTLTCAERDATSRDPA